MLEEEFTSPSSVQHFLNIIGEDGEYIKILKGTMYWTKPGVLVHNVPLPPTVSPEVPNDELLHTECWDKFKPDYHCLDTFITCL